MSSVVQISALARWASDGTAKTNSLTGVAAGNTILVLGCHQRFFGGTAGVTTVNDGSAYAAAVTTKNYFGVQGALWAYIRQGVAANNYTITTTLAGAAGDNFGTSVAIEINGIQTAAVDQTTSNSGTSTTPTSGTTGTLSQAAELVIAMMGSDGSASIAGATIPPTTGYTAIASDTSATYLPFSFGYKTVSATTAVSAAWGTLPSSDQWGGLIFTFADVVTGVARLVGGTLVNGTLIGAAA